MTGIYLLFLAIIWLAFAAGLSFIGTAKLKHSTLRIPIACLVFVAVLPLPVLDELLGKPQFEQLCKQYSAVELDTANSAGRTIWFGDSQRTELQLGAIQVSRTKRSYVDVRTQEPVYHYFRLEAKGGWLLSHLGLSETGGPLLFRAVCQPKDLEAIEQRLGVTHINRPSPN
jgi:hypothetical protein